MTAYGPPIDLSGLPNYRTPEEGGRRPAFVGRVSTKDNQSPATSLPRQVALASERLEPGQEFVAFYYDVESGMLPPELRGLGPDESYAEMNIPVPRDGGLQDLMDQVPERGITHVVAERSDRVARAMLTSLNVEHALHTHGVEVIYANEPTGGTHSGRLRTRRYGQADAEIYRATMMEMSTGGQHQHVVGGWNHGVPPYPYEAVVDDNAPVPDRGRFGPRRPKRKLVPHSDSRRFSTAKELVRLRLEEKLSGRDIIDVFASRPDLHPIETRWTHSRIEGLLANPKLTGHQVYNRRATRTFSPGHSPWNPISEWVWSPAIAHEPVLSVEDWARVQEITASLRRQAMSGIARIQEAARRAGLRVEAVDESETHMLYRIGSHCVVLPQGSIPDAVADQVINNLAGVQ